VVSRRHSHYFVSELAYSYRVNNEYYSGRFTKDFDAESEAWDYAKNAKGKTVVVRFHPELVQRSCVANQTVLTS